jgi:predicted nucleic acid-binding protein
MIVIDSSAWIEFLRRTGSPTHHTLRRLLDEQAPLAITEMVAVEVLAGARDQLVHHRLRRKLVSCRMLRLNGLPGFESAAKLAQRCRAQGITPSVTDCLIAAPTLNAGAALLHADRDFNAIASVTDLAIYPLDDA